MNNLCIKRSTIGGKGLFATKNIPAGKLVAIVEGPIVPNDEDSCKKYGPHYLHAVSYSKAILNSNFTKYTNHCCDPNCGLKEGINIVALRDIKSEEEITIDYDTLDYEWEMECNCASPNCRKVLRGYRYLSSSLKKRYKGFISPYLLRKPKIL
jgi:SET domain-containing protein